MAKNKMEEFAKLLGVELNEEFTIEETANGYKLTNRGLYYYDYYAKKWCHSTHSFERLLLGLDNIIKISKPILDDVEKNYLSNIIKPFRNKVKGIRKISSPTENFEYIRIYYHDHDYTNVLNFPDFKVGKMYKGMELDELYTLKELGL